MIVEFHTKDITTSSDLHTFIAGLVKAFDDNRIEYTDSLEEYLRALWSLVQRHRDSQLSYSLMAELIASALSAESAPFDERWLTYTKPFLPEPPEDTGTFEMLNDTLLYQIADLHRMKLTGQLDQSPSVLYMGVNSPTGHTWYNFDVAGFLNQGRRCFPVSEAIDWADFIVFLWCGQIYE